MIDLIDLDGMGDGTFTRIGALRILPDIAIDNYVKDEISRPSRGECAPSSFAFWASLRDTDRLIVIRISETETAVPMLDIERPLL